MLSSSNLKEWLCSLCEVRTSFCIGLIYRKHLPVDSYLYFWLPLGNPVFYFFFLFRPPSSLCSVFDAITSNIDEVFSINPSADVFVFGDFNVCLKDWLTYSGGTDMLVNSIIIILSQMTLLRWLTFLPRSLTVTLTVLLFQIYLFLLVFVLQWLSLHREILIMFLSQFLLTFHQTQNGMAHFIP